jgi:hypothetical protein
MNWESGELRKIKVGVSSKRRNKKAYKTDWKSIEVPAPYDRIVSQLLAEAAHATTDHGHESRRRESYALRTLDRFGEELVAYTGPPHEFRSRVLTPILQRQRRGVHDAYAPSVRAAIPSETGSPNIDDVSEFYLKDDPTDPSLIQQYRRHLIYIPEARWHLGLIMKVAHSSSVHFFNKVRENHDRLMEALANEEGDTDDGEDEGEDEAADVPAGRVEPFTEAEVQVIVDERLERFFELELAETVCIPSPCYQPPLIIDRHSRNCLRPPWSRGLSGTRREPI